MDLKKVIGALQKSKFPTHVYSIGKMKSSMIVQFPEANVKIDLFRATKTNFAAMLLYSTGSKEFNIMTRKVAKKLGLKLNQNGIFDAKGKRFPTKTEKDLFKILKLDYLEPHKR